MLRIWTIYDNPDDYPGQFVARLFLGEQPTDSVIVSDDLQTLRNVLRRQALYRLPRQEDDDPVIVETWL